MKPGTIEETSLQSPRQNRAENIWLNLGLNIAVPVLFLKKGAAWFPDLSPGTVLTIALAFPVGYFFYDLWRRAKYNFISVLGFVSVLLTGGIGLLQLDPNWIAVKEAGIPLLIGLIVVGSLKTPFPLVRKMLFNQQIMDLPKVNRAIEERQAQAGLDKLLNTCTWWLAGSFFFSAVLNFILARIIVTTSPAVDAAAFNNEIGSLALWSWPVIVVPCMAVMMIALWKLLTGLKKLTGLDIEEIFNNPGETPEPAKEPRG